MKTIVLMLAIIVAVLGGVDVQGQENSSGQTEMIALYQGNWKETLALAKQENKPIFLDINTQGCAPCSKLKNETFTDASVRQYFTENFISVSVDMEDASFRRVIRQLKPSSYPALYFLNQKGGPVAYTAGFLTPKQLISIAREGHKNSFHKK